MKVGFKLLSLSLLVLSACVHEGANTIQPVPPIRHMQCPTQDMLSSGITRAKPGSAEELVRQTIVPPGLAAGQQWNINGFASEGPQLYLSCFYRTRKILTYKLPLEKELCMAKDTDKNVSVECVKK